MKVYIAGKVTGLDRDKVELKFENAKKLLHEAGYSVLNPVKIARVDDSPKRAMGYLLPLMLQCDAILLLNDWQFSEGAKIEAALARYAGMHIINEDDLT